LDLADILTIIVTIVVLYELIEHLIFPLAWSIIMRNRKHLSGIESMVGKEIEVKKWQDTKGMVFFKGELWKATSDHQLLPGDKAIIEKVDGLLLRVTRCNED
jgi:membrane-bound ClpP family serine protease